MAARAKSGDKMDRRPRFGWSGYGGRGPISPFASSLGHDGQPPDIMDEDFSYITSQDLENHNIDRSRYYDPRTSSQRVARSEPPLEIPDDDVVLIKNRGITYPEHFPAYSIGDGKLLAGDIRDRAQLIMKLSNRQTNNLKMLYKGKQLKDNNEAVCKYGVKNKSEVLIVLPEDDVDVGGGRSSSETSEEIVVVQSEDGNGRSGRKKSKRGRKKPQAPSPRESGSSVGLSVPEGDQRRKRAPSVSRTRSPERPASGTTIAVSRPPLIPAAPNSAMDKLNKIQANFDDSLRPICEEFVANPPDDAKECVAQYRKISETVLQQVLLKLDEIDTGGDDSIRMRRKELVKYVQEVLKPVDKYSPDTK